MLLKQMNKRILITLLLLALGLVCIFGALGTMVSKKYAVDEMYWHTDGNGNLTTEEKQKALDALDNKGKRLQAQTAAWAAGALVMLGAGTVQLVKGHR